MSKKQGIGKRESQSADLNLAGKEQDRKEVHL
jgi:hypothetical protein